MNFLCRWAFCLSFLLPAVANSANCRADLKPASPIEHVGIYTNTAPNSYKFYTKGEHGYLMDIELWHAGDCFFGRFRASEGTEGDPSLGAIDDFAYDPKSKMVSFRSKLTLGVFYQNSKDTTGTPTKDLFEFAGKFDYRQFVGTMTSIDKSGDANPRPTKTQKTVFKLQKDSESLLSGITHTYAAWLEHAQLDSKQSGPKW